MKYCIDPKLLKEFESSNMEDPVLTKIANAHVQFRGEYIKHVIGEAAYNWALENPDQIEALGDVGRLIQDSDRAFMDWLKFKFEQVKAEKSE